MRDPRNYFINPFVNDKISYAEMAAFATDHIGKLGNFFTPSLAGGPALSSPGGGGRAMGAAAAAAVAAVAARVRHRRRAR
ncbi:MAG: hypothetical protein MI807_03965 [Verrucomicrobiales bacterium]|nr:hypothetical protein [Verrucomicrobiales bacterium]